jgi:hypothetical protein
MCANVAEGSGRAGSGAGMKQISGAQAAAPCQKKKIRAHD